MLTKSENGSRKFQKTKASRRAHGFRSVRLGFGSNLGHPPARKTLWIFGAGASAHLGFPLSINFFAKSIKLLTNMVIIPNPYFFISGGDISDYKKVKTDPEFALEQIQLWSFLRTRKHCFAEFQYLLKEWRKLPKLLCDSGLSINSKIILKHNPEDLIDTIKKLPLPHNNQKIQKSRQKAIECICLIYFYTLSVFNEKARNKRMKGHRTFYDNFVSAIDIEPEHRIISFNYDTMLDEAFFSYFTKSWAYGGVNIAGFNGHPVGKRKIKTDVVLIKPHGSLNFMECGNCKRVHVQWFRKYLPTGAGQLSSYNRRCVYCKKPTPMRLELMDQLVVPPFYDKKTIKRSKQVIVDSFAWVDNIVSIGFSFSKQDDYFFEYMSKGLKKNKNANIAIHIVGKDKRSAENIKAQLEKSDKLEFLTTSRYKVKAVDIAGFEGVEVGRNFPNIDIITIPS